MLRLSVSSAFAARCWEVQRISGGFGVGLTQIAPIYEGFAFKEAAAKVSVAGEDLTRFLQGLFEEKGYSFTSFQEYKILGDYKAKVCYVPLDYELEHNMAASSSHIDRCYELPDGQVISPGFEIFQTFEPLFKPTLLKDTSTAGAKGIHEEIVQSIKKSEKECKSSELFSNILLTGGTSQARELQGIIQREVSLIAPTGTKI